MARTVITGNQDLGTVEFDQLSGTGAVDASNILDQDGLTDNSADALATQQSIKAYVDNNVGGITLELCKAFLSAVDINNGTVYAQRNLFPVTGSLNINQGSFTSTTAGITVPSTGLYICSFNLQTTGTGPRSAPEARFSINGTGQNESSVCSYLRNNNGHQDVSLHLSTIYNLTANDVIGIQSRATAQTAAQTTKTTSDVTIYRVS